MTATYVHIYVHRENRFYPLLASEKQQGAASGNADNFPLQAALLALAAAPYYVHFSCCSLIASASAASPQLYLLANSTKYMYTKSKVMRQ